MSFAWFSLSDGRSVYRRVEQQPRGQRSGLAMPQLVRPFSQPVQSMATGEWCDTPADLRRTHRASGNPQGIDYVEVGDDRSFVEPAPKQLARPDKKAIREAVERGKADVSAGKYNHII